MPTTDHPTALGSETNFPRVTSDNIEGDAGSIISVPDNLTFNTVTDPSCSAGDTLNYDGVTWVCVSPPVVVCKPTWYDPQAVGLSFATVIVAAAFYKWLTR